METSKTGIEEQLFGWLKDMSWPEFKNILVNISNLSKNYKRGYTGNIAVILGIYRMRQIRCWWHKKFLWRK